MQVTAPHNKTLRRRGSCVRFPALRGADRFPHACRSEDMPMQDKAYPPASSSPDPSEDFAGEMARIPALRDLMVKAMRFAADVEGMPQRCRRKDCRRARSCQFVFDREGGGHCGAGIDSRTIDRAALMLAFLIRLMRRQAPVEVADGAIAPAPARASAR